jgi:hypothetical protein
MVEIRVAVPDATRAHGLMRRLAGPFDRSSISFDGAQSEVRVRLERESHGVVQVLRAVESWLADDGPDSTRRNSCLGHGSFTAVRPVPIASDS